jgi:hypothetical protein
MGLRLQRTHEEAGLAARFHQAAILKLGVCVDGGGHAYAMLVHGVTQGRQLLTGAEDAAADEFLKLGGELMVECWQAAVVVIPRF